ncbi:MAG: FprA family A-type flavoprotein [Synergistetes bacterium]|nr:FprA family A-type flavoprotein [Synergistota bacterium]
MPKVWIKKLFEEPEIHLLRIDDDKIKFFEAIWDIPEGITYNAYIMKIKDNIVLFDTWKDTYSREFLDAIKSIVNPEDITHIVVHHTEPDHSGALPALLEANKKKVRIICSSLAKKLLDAFYGIRENIKTVEDGEEIELGNNRLKFIYVPWLHWPDTIITYLPDKGIIFGCDVGGGYSIPDNIDDANEANIEKYLKHVTKYIVTVIGHYKKYIPENFEKLEGMGVLNNLKAILPGHGLIWMKEPMKLLEHYAKVAKGDPQKEKALVIYDSMYGFVEKGITIAIDELKKSGTKPLVYGFTDTNSPALSEILKEIPDSKFIIFGFSTYEASLHPIAKYLIYEILDKANYEKPVLALGNFGWAGALKRELQKLLKDSDLKLVDIIEINGKTKEEDELKIREGIKKLIQQFS